MPVAFSLPPGSLGPNQLEDFALLGKASERFLGEDLRAIHRDFEHPTAPRDQLTVDGKDLLQLGRQTGGSRLVVSLNAVLDLDSHDGSSARIVAKLGEQPMLRSDHVDSSIP